MRPKNFYQQMNHQAWAPYSNTNVWIIPFSHKPKTIKKKKAHLNGTAPGFDVLLSLLDAKLHVADVLAEQTAAGAVKCSVL